MRKPTRLDIEPGVERDERFLREALREARRAGRAGEVPIGCVIVMEDDVVGRGHNRPVTACDPTAHAEIVALRRSARKIGNYRLTGAEVFVTVEPCLMCFGAFVHARVGRVVYGASDPKVGSLRRPHPFRPRSPKPSDPEALRARRRTRNAIPSGSRSTVRAPTSTLRAGPGESSLHGTRL